MTAENAAAAEEEEPPEEEEACWEEAGDEDRRPRCRACQARLERLDVGPRPSIAEIMRMPLPLGRRNPQREFW